MSETLRIQPPGPPGKALLTLAVPDSKQLLSVQDPFITTLAGPGGSRVIIASAMMYAVYDWAAINVDRSGGVSGGAPGAALYANGTSGKELVHLALDTNFGKKVKFDFSWSGLLAAIKQAFSKWRIKGLPEKALLCTSPLGHYVKEMTGGVWPAKFWTLAMTHEARYVMTAKGVWRINWLGESEKIADTPPPIETAIAATTAIPLIMHGVPCKIGDRDLVLFDGGIAHPMTTRLHADCPIEVAYGLYGKHRLFVFDVGPDMTWIGKRIADARNSVVHTPPVPAAPDWAIEDEFTGVINCPVPDLPTLNLAPSRDCKWTILMRGFHSTVEALDQAGLLNPDKLAQAHEISARYEEISAQVQVEQQQAALIRDASKRKRRQAELEGLLSTQLEALMHAHGLY